MSRELQKRILFTCVLLLLAQVLRYIPIPGVSLAVFIAFPQTSPEFDTGAISRAMIGSLGLGPYVSASILVILFYYFRRFRRGVEENNFPIVFYTLALTAALALLQGYGIAVFLENLPSTLGLDFVPHPGWRFRIVCMLSLSAGVLLLVWLAHLISQKGLGNGVCLIVLVALLGAARPTAFEFVRQLASGNLALPQAFFMYIVIGGILFFAALALVLAQWQPFSSHVETIRAPTALAFRLRVNGVGVVGITMAQSVLFIPVTLAAILPDGFPGQELFQSFSSAGFSYWLTFGILVLVATYFWTAWAYRFGGARATLQKFSGTSVLLPLEKEFERKLVLVTVPLAVGLPLLLGVLTWMGAAHAIHLVPLSIAIPVIAIACDLSRQFRSHQRMAATFSDHEKAGVCEECRGSVSENDQACPACGIVFDESLHCDAHAGVVADAVCIFCQRRLCADCGLLHQGRYVCEEHGTIEVNEGWATAQTSTTRFEAELTQQKLQEHGMTAMVFSNTIEPQAGTLGLFEINPITPFLPYRELGGGRIRVMVPARDWLRAQSLLTMREQQVEF